MAENSGSIGGMYFDLGLNIDDLSSEFDELHDKLADAVDTSPVDDLNNSLDKASKNTKKLNENLKDTNNEMNDVSENTEDFSQVVDKVGTGIKRAFEIKAVIDFSKACIGATNAQQAAEAKLNTIMSRRMQATKDEIQSVKDLASELQGLGVVGDEVTLAGAAQLATFTTSLDAMKTLLPAMANAAVSVSNGEAVTSDKMIDAAKKFGKAMSTGSLSELEEYGFVVSDAELASWEQLTSQEEKAAYLANLVSSRIGDLNGTMRGQFNGAVQGLVNDFGDLEEKFGRLMQVVLLPVVNILDKIVLKLSEMTDKVMDFFGIEMDTSGTENLLSNTEAVSNNLSDATDKAKELERTLLGFDKVFKLSDPNKESSSATTGSSTNDYYTTNNNTSSGNTSIGEGTEAGDDGSTAYGRRIFNATGRMASAAGTAFMDFVGSILSGYENSDWGKWWKEGFWPDFTEDYEGFCDTVVRMIEDDSYWTEIGDAFGEVFGWLGDKIDEKVSDFWGSIKDSWHNLMVKFGLAEPENVRARNGSFRNNTDNRTGLGKFWDAITWWPFAEGGFVKANNPIPAIVGDNRSQNEWIFPQDKLKALLTEASSMGGNGNSEILNQILQAILGLNLTADVDATAMGRLIIRMIQQESRATGRSLI